MASVAKSFHRITIGITVMWTLMLCLFIANFWCQLSISYCPPVRQDTYWNHLWTADGRIAWARIDPAIPEFEQQYKPPSWKFQLNTARSSNWIWKPYYVRDYSGRYAGVPLWIPLVLFLPFGPVPLAAERLKARRQNRFAAERRCPSCGYPTDGLPVGVCPECGHTDLTT
jgi:hypothetical protein